MNKASYTKGPWKCNPIDRAGIFAVIPPNHENGTVVSTDEALANARLIASAPDMLESLRWCIAALKYHGIDSSTGELDRAVAVAAKAEGRE